MSDSDYPWEVIPDPSGGYTIRFPDLPGCMSQVETLYHVGNVAAEIRDLWLETAREAGMAIPEPGSYEADYRRLRELIQRLEPVLARTEEQIEDVRAGTEQIMPAILCLCADYRRLRDLERACRMARIIPGGLKGHYYAHEQAGLDAIGRLLEGER